MWSAVVGCMCLCVFAIVGRLYVLYLSGVGWGVGFLLYSFILCAFIIVNKKPLERKKEKISVVFVSVMVFWVVIDSINQDICSLSPPPPPCGVPVSQLVHASPNKPTWLASSKTNEKSKTIITLLVTLLKTEYASVLQISFIVGK